MSREPAAPKRRPRIVPRAASSPRRTSTGPPVGEHGQISIVAAVVIAVLLVFVYAIVAVGAAMIDRQAAVIASDATALAVAMGDASTVVEHYRREGIEVAVANGRSDSVIGSAPGIAEWTATASSRAERDDTLVVAPALVAVVARAEQVLGRELAPVIVEGITIELDGGDARDFEVVAADLRMCPVMARSPGASAWVLC